MAMTLDSSSSQTKTEPMKHELKPFLMMQSDPTCQLILNPKVLENFGCLAAIWFWL